MANAVFATKINPTYDDLPEARYHFPRAYLNQAKATIGDWILYYEPRREDASPSGRAGRQVYFATARVVRIEEDPRLADHFYANVEDYIEFAHPVPFRAGAQYFESALRKNDGTTNKGAFGRAVRIIPFNEYQTIVKLGFADAPLVQQKPPSRLVAEEPEADYERPIIKRITERPFRDATFAIVVRNAYGATCAMTGLRLINGGGRCEVEAAHIRPVSEHGPDSIRNGLALSRTVHWMFDRGLVSIADDGKILIARRLVPEVVKRMLNPTELINLPTNPAARPHPQFLRFHRENIFKG